MSIRNIYFDKGTQVNTVNATWTAAQEILSAVTFATARITVNAIAEFAIVTLNGQEKLANVPPPKWSACHEMVK